MRYRPFWIRRLVKESTDNLSAGLLFYHPDGMVKLCNTKMVELSICLSGAPLSNGADFYEKLNSGAYPGSVSGGETPLVTFDDGTAYSFMRYKNTIDGIELFELVAVDVTEEYRLYTELLQKEEKLSAINERLRVLSGEIRYHAMEQETLSAKIRIHDNLGQLLLLTKRYLLYPEEVSLAMLLSEWHLQSSLLQREGDEIWNEPYFADIRSLEALGVRVWVEGRLPEGNARFNHVIATALRVHITNVLKHAKGTEAFVRVSESECIYRLAFTNDGIKTEDPIREAGGLLNLRREVEAIGGKMEIQIEGGFCLILTLPKSF